MRTSRLLELDDLRDDRGQMYVVDTDGETIGQAATRYSTTGLAATRLVARYIRLGANVHWVRAPATVSGQACHPP
jgi:hypothetical protein